MKIKEDEEMKPANAQWKTYVIKLLLQIKIKKTGSVRIM
jgi:hypothetical protein